MTLGYNYARHKLKNPPGIISTLTHIGREVTWRPSRLAYALALIEKYESLNCLTPSTSFTRTKNLEVLTNFDTSTLFTLWDSVCTHSINPYFQLYTEYKPLDWSDNAEVNGIRRDHQTPWDRHRHT